MASFSADEIDDERLDWTILRDGGVALYWRTEILSDDLNWLQSNGYRLITFDASEWQSPSGWESGRRMHESLKDQLSFPDYYGMNIHALDECMCDDLAVPDSGGLALVLSHYDQFQKATRNPENTDESDAETVLTIFANAVRYHTLLGRRLLILVQSDDPRIVFGRLGGVGASWNHREWLNKSRGC
jgi:RNAse (barnase) inhibitor barstar